MEPNTTLVFEAAQATGEQEDLVLSHHRKESPLLLGSTLRASSGAPGVSIQGRSRTGTHDQVFKLLHEHVGKMATALYMKMNYKRT